MFGSEVLPEVTIAVRAREPGQGKNMKNKQRILKNAAQEALMRLQLNLKKSKLFAIAAIAGFLIAMTPPPSEAEVPTKFNFQGRLVEPSTDDPLDGSFDMVFRICDHLTNPCTGGSKLWEELQTMSIDNGIFEAVFGSVVAIDSSVFSGPAYLEIEVETEALSPRQEIVPQPLALRASIADGLEPGDGDYIQMRETLQTGATFYVSSGTVSGKFSVGGQVHVVGQARVEGVLITGSGANQITTTAGLIDGGKLDPAFLIPNASINPSSVSKFNSLGLIPNDHIDGASITKRGNSFNAANQLLLLDGSGNVPNANLDSSIVTQEGNTFNGANQLAILDAGGFIVNATLDASIVTKEGNTFNGANQLVRLNGTTQLPAVDGSLLTGIADPTKLPLAGGTMTGAIDFGAGSSLDAAIQDEISISTHIRVTGYVARFGFFYSRRTTEFDNLVADAFTQFDLDGVDVADAEFYSEAAGVITIGKTGLYLIDTSCTFDLDGGQRDDAQCAVFINGTRRNDLTCSSYSRETGRLGTSCSNHGLINLVSGNTLDMRMRGDTADVDLGGGVVLVEPATLRMEFVR